MIQHIVMFKFQETACGKTKAENLEEARQRMLALREQIPQIRGMEVRLAAPGSAPGNYDYILISQFDSMEELEIYQKHPAHVAFGKFVTELREPDGGDPAISYSTEFTWLEDPDPADNTLTVVLSILADGDLEGKVLHIPGLWKQTDGKAYTEIFSGDFDFVLSGGLAEDSLLAVDVAGVTAQAPCGTLTMERLKVSPLGLQWSYHYDENAVQAAAAENGRDAVALVTADSGEVVEFSDIAIPDTELLLVLKDGTQVEVASSFSKGDSGWMEQSGFFARPVDLSQADYLLWGEAEIPLH